MIDARVWSRRSFVLRRITITSAKTPVREKLEFANCRNRVSVMRKLPWNQSEYYFEVTQKRMKITMCKQYSDRVIRISSPDYFRLRSDLPLVLFQYNLVNNRLILSSSRLNKPKTMIP